MREQELLYVPSLLEEALEPVDHALVPPGRGFHTLYERMVRLDDGTWALVAYVEGGARCGDRYTIVIHENRCGWARGFRLPVPMRPLSTLSVKDFRGLTSEKLLLIKEVPGFSQSGTHEQGWYTQSCLVREIPPGAALPPESRIFLLREGVYVYFPDKSIRLMTYTDYFSLPEIAPDFRQGNLLIYKQERNVSGEEYISIPEEVSLVSIDRHQIFVAEYELHSVMCRDWLQGGRIEHPDHEPVILPADDDGPDWAVKGYTWQYLPSVSRPF